jgi:AcrR family transcriptional regulator
VRSHLTFRHFLTPRLSFFDELSILGARLAHPTRILGTRTTSMTSLSRKQREIAERHSHFLSIARTLLHEEGFHQLSMDRVAELAEYSKGTVYQHFPCKEEMLGQLCISAMQRMLALGRRALAHQGSHRERLMAFFIAHDVFQTLEVNDVMMMQNFHTDQVLEKLSPITRQRHDELQANIFAAVKSIVEDAMDAGDLPREHATSSDIVFGLWSLSHGAESLRSCNLPFSELGVDDTTMAVVVMLQKLLDGLGWKPLSDSCCSIEKIQELKSVLFKDELLAAQQPHQ